MIQTRTMLSVEEICQKLRPIFGDKIDKIYFNYITSESNEAKEEIFSMLNALYQKHFNYLLDGTTHLEPPKKENVLGDYKFGDVQYAGKNLYPFMLREHDLPRHVCISGMSGSGKTTLAFNILEEFIKKDKPFLVFDWKKSFRPLLSIDQKSTCFTVGDSRVTNNFKINLNKPPKGVSPKEWIVVICDLIAESFFVSYGVHKILLETLDDAFKEWGVYNGSEKYPTWNHIRWRLEEKLESAKSRSQGWIESALRVATVLTFGDFGTVLNYVGENSVGVEEILDKRVIFELNSLGNIEKKFFSELILTYIYKLKKAEQNTSSDKFDYAILVDEAHNIFLKDKTKFVSESVTDMVYRELREYGVSLICLDQHVSKLSDTVKGNSACHIAFQQQLPEDIDSISRLMLLNDKKTLFSDLPVGLAVVKMNERYSKPFFINVNNNLTRNNQFTENEMKKRAELFNLKNEFENNQDSIFVSQTINAKEIGIEDLFKKINLPKTLNLYANRDKRVQDSFVENSENPMRDTIFATIRRRLNQGEDLILIEKDLEALYDKNEVSFAINQFMEAELRKKALEEVQEISKESTFNLTENVNENEKDIPVIKPKLSINNFKKLENEKKEKEKTYKVSLDSSKYTYLTDEESKFITFLEKNPNHELTTVNLYKEVGLSPRKGNNVKNQLIEKSLIKIEELKNEKGWKKIIRLS